MISIEVLEFSIDDKGSKKSKNYKNQKSNYIFKGILPSWDGSILL